MIHIMVTHGKSDHGMTRCTSVTSYFYNIEMFLCDQTINMEIA